MRAQEHCAEVRHDVSADQVSDGGSAGDRPGRGHRTGPRAARAVAGPGSRPAGGAAAASTSASSQAEGGTVTHLVGLPEGPRGGGWIEWKRVRQGQRVYGPYPYLRLRLGGRQRSIYLRALAQATREAAASEGQVNPSL